MRSIAILILAIAATACAMSPRSPAIKGIEASRSLGHGFWLITAAEEVQGSFESIGHFGYCYYRNKNLGRCDRMWPSPSGQFAVYQAASTGHIFLFDTHTGLSTQLTQEFPGLMWSASWREQEKKVIVQVGAAGPEREISLSYAQAGGT
ncbi:hypothetical protein [Thermomonas haemolytica]|uniref:hypothetical protein n=1 Tax=Thermomonas haemolytica TaxID=141949 RepID=UPI00104FC2AD|nr:hypothetical protein [Thermomonas haemolytica]